MPVVAAERYVGRGVIMWAGAQGRDMHELRIREDQAERLAEIQEELAAAHAGPYASVQTEDAVEYLLDLAEEADDRGTPAESAEESDTASASASAEASATDEDAGQSEDEASDDDSAGGMFDLLETHSDKWREADGEEPYEVDLPDGGVETVRTRDDVKATLFREYR
jgi:hypothetical protein